MTGVAASLGIIALFAAGSWFIALLVYAACVAASRDDDLHGRDPWLRSQYEPLDQGTPE